MEKLSISIFSGITKSEDFVVKVLQVIENQRRREDRVIIFGYVFLLTHHNLNHLDVFQVESFLTLESLIGKIVELYFQRNYQV